MLSRSRATGPFIAVAVGVVLAAGAVRAAPPSSAMTSPELAPPEAVPKSLQTTTTFKCTGYYRSHECVSTLWLNDCKHSIKITWSPLKLPGSLEWARKHRNWCSISYDGAGPYETGPKARFFAVSEERKMEPAKCDALMRLLAGGLQGFPEVKWQDAQCTHIGTPDGILYVTQRFVRTVDLPHFQAPKPSTDPEPRAVRLEDVRSCSLHLDKKKRIVRCPVLPQEVHDWLKRLLAFVDVHLQLQNDLK